MQDNGSLHNSHQPLLLSTIIHHTAHNGLLIFIIHVTYTTPSVVMYSPENITAIGEHNQTHQMFSLSVVFRKKKKWESSVLAARGNGNYPITRVLYHRECMCYLLGTDTGKALQIIPVNLNYIWHAVKSLDFKKLRRAPQGSADCALSTAGLGFLEVVVSTQANRHRGYTLVVYEPTTDPCVC